MVPKKSEEKSLQSRITELEQKLADAQATILSLQAEKGQNGPSKRLKSSEDILFSSDEGFKLALLSVPYPLMIWREDGRILMVNTAFTEISGYTVEDIPTIDAWSVKALAGRFQEQPSSIFYEELPGREVKKAREFEITTRSGETRIWDFSYSVLGTDQAEHWLMLTMAVDITERRQIEDLMEEHEKKFAIIFDKAPFAAALSKLSDGVITDVNEEFERALGYTRNEVLGRNSLEIGFNPNPEARALMLEQFKNRGNVRNVETFLRTKSGETRNFLLNLDEVLIGDQKYIFQTAQDITERKRSEQAIRDSEELFSKAYHKSPFGMNITRWKDGVILDANSAWLNLLGWTREEILGKTTGEFPFYAHPEDLSWVWERIMREEVPGDMELNILHKDGTKLVVNLASSILDLQGERCILGILNDITERRQAEEALRESEERYRAVVENAGDAIIVSDPSCTGRVLSANPAACKMFGYSLEEFKALDREAMLDSSDSRLENFLKNRDQYGNGKGELTYIRREGVRFPGELTSVFFNNRNGQQNSIAIIRDISERKKAEQAFRESEQRYRGLFESMQEGLIAGEVITDESGRPINFRYLEVNPATEQQYGIPRQKFIGHTYTDVLPEGDQAWIDILGSVALTGKPASVERYSQVSGKWFEAHAYSPLPGQFVNILTDITERKKTEEALRKSEERFSKAFRAIPDAVVISRMSDGLILDTNEGWSRIFGHEQREVVGQSSLELGVYADPKDREKAAALFTEHGSLHDFELQIRIKSGEIRQASISSERIEINGVDYLLTILRDITDRKKAEEALQRFQLLSEHSRDIILFMRLQDGHILEANAAAQAYGYSHTELLELTISDLRHADTSNLTVEQMAKANESGILFETIHRRKDGSSFPVEVSSQGAMIGGIRTLVSIVRDITERKLAEEQLKIYASRLEKSNRELEQFAFMASHDLQEPLRKIEMFGDLLLERAASLEGNERMYLDRMRKAAGRMRGMIEGLLQISRVATQGKPFIQVDLYQVTREVLSDLDDQIRDTGGKVEVGRLPAVTGDPLQLRQLMQNLIGNALKYRQAGQPPEVRVFAEKLPERVQIFVQDKGIGFPQEDADRIFEPFQRLVGRNEYEGSGIGLAICRRIVERHSGELAVKSEPGQGTTFMIGLPIPPTKESKRES